MVSNVMEKMILYFGDDTRRISHALKVYGFAKAIAGGEAISEEKQQIVELCGILHDIGIKEAEKKYNSNSGKYQEIEGPPIAEKMLEEVGIEKAISERVCYIIGNHHSYYKIDEVDFQILVEADFIVNIEEDSIAADSIKSIKEKYFKTATGIKLLESLF